MKLLFLRTAQCFCYAQCQNEYDLYQKRDFDAGKLKSLAALINSKGIICVKSRAESAMKSHYGNEEFPILTYKDPLWQIWMTEVHKEELS